jgi:hypothetical protein
MKNFGIRMFDSEFDIVPYSINLKLKIRNSKSKHGKTSFIR